METRQPVDLKELSLIARSKRELYLVLLNDCKIYMPLIQDINEGYIRDVFAGSIKFIKSSDVKLIQVFHPDSTTTKKIFEFACKKVDESICQPTILQEHLTKYGLEAWCLKGYQIFSFAIQSEEEKARREQRSHFNRNEEYIKEIHYLTKISDLESKIKGV